MSKSIYLFIYFSSNLIKKWKIIPRVNCYSLFFLTILFKKGFDSDMFINISNQISILAILFCQILFKEGANWHYAIVREQLKLDCELKGYILKIFQAAHLYFKTNSSIATRKMRLLYTFFSLSGNMLICSKWLHMENCVINKFLTGNFLWWFCFLSCYFLSSFADTYILRMGNRWRVWLASQMLPLSSCSWSREWFSNYSIGLLAYVISQISLLLLRCEFPLWMRWNISIVFYK